MNILLIPNLEKQNVKEYTFEIINILNTLKHKSFLSNEIDIEFPRKIKICTDELESFINDIDLIITIGGDGTILKSSILASTYDIPILGVNMGRLGFIASLERDELHKLSLLNSKEFIIEKRMMLTVSITNLDGNTETYNALNDVVIANSSYSKVCEFDVSVDNAEIIKNVRADGIVFSTPTGATAYSLSAGGPIIEPDMECIEFTQICPHSLFSRSMLFSSEKVLSVNAKSKDNNQVCVYVDGNEICTFDHAKRIEIKKSNSHVKLINLNGYNFYDCINKKLMQPLKKDSEEL